METLLQDIRYAVRMLRKSPGFAAITVITLALGIGANTGLFSVVNAVVINPLPYPNPERLISLYARTPAFQQVSISYLNFLDWQKDNRTFDSIAGYRNEDFTLTNNGESERLHGHMISAGFFGTIGATPKLGREFRLEEDQPGAPPVALISEGLWKSKFASSPEIIGNTFTLDSKPYTIVGVVPGHFPMLSDSDVFVPIGQWNDPTFRDRRLSMGMYTVGRLKDGVTIEQARSDMDRIAKNLAAAYPEANANTTILLISLKKDIIGDVEPFLFTLLAAVGFVLLIACANVANLLLARSTGRSREFTIRMAVGANFTQIVRQLLTEAILLGIVGGGLGLLLAKFGTQAVLAALPSALPRADEIGLDARVLLFTLGISLLASIIFGLAPAWKTAQPDLQETLRESGRGMSATRHRAQSIFVMAEVALALVLLIGAGLMIRTLAALWHSDPGFDPHNVLTFNISLSSSKIATAADIRSAYRELLNRFAAIPGVEAVSLDAGALPMQGDSEIPFWKEGQPKPANDSDMSWTLYYGVTPDYPKVMSLPLLRGRFLTADDNESSSAVAVVDESFAHKFFPNEDPIGKRINLGLVGTQPEIVGVVRHVNQWGLAAGQQNIQAQLYFPMMQIPDKFMPLAARGVPVVVRTAGAPGSIADAFRGTSRKFDPSQIVYGFMPMERIVADSIATQRFSMILLGTFASLALLLAAIGIYGVVSYLVGQRTQEMGIRIALGAQRSDVLTLVLAEGGKMASVGVCVGLLAALALTRLMTTMLFGVSARDPLTFVALPTILVGIAIGACYIPARRATRVDPMVALRYE